MAALRSENGTPTAQSLDSTQAFLDMMQVETLTCDMTSFLYISLTVFACFCTLTGFKILKHVQLHFFCGLSALSAEMR